MQIQTYKWLFIIPGIALAFGGCSISDWYNGYYAETNAIRKEYNNRMAYYAAQTPEWREAFKKNTQECGKLAGLPENRVHGGVFSTFNEGLFRKCMEEKGTKYYE